eukprot:PhF_6_TR3322/c0_g1_i1/m.4689
MKSTTNRSNTPPSHTSSSFYRSVRENFAGPSAATSRTDGGPSPVATTLPPSHHQMIPTPNSDLRWRSGMKPYLPTAADDVRQSPQRAGGYAPLRSHSPSVLPPSHFMTTTPIQQPVPPQQPQQQRQSVGPAAGGVDDDCLNAVDMDSIAAVEFSGGLSLSGTVGGGGLHTDMTQAVGGGLVRLPMISADIVVRFTARHIVFSDRSGILLEVPLAELYQVMESVGFGGLQMEIRNPKGHALLEIGTQDPRKRVAMYKVLCSKKNTWERCKGEGLLAYHQGPVLPGGGIATTTASSNMNTNNPPPTTPAPSSSGDPRTPNAHLLQYAGGKATTGGTTTSKDSGPARPLAGWSPPLVVNGKPITP